MGVRVEVLGPLRLWVSGAQVPVPGAQRRALLAVLALAEGRAVTVDALVDALWPDDPPATGSQALMSHISRLRRHLGGSADALRREGAGYRLIGVEVDAADARRLAEQAGSPGLEPVRAAQTARTALRLWRGRALAEFAEVMALAAYAVALDDLYDILRDTEIAARLTAADPTAIDQVVQDAAQVARDAPLRERPTLHWMQALALAGRANEAMDLAAGYRRALADATGLDPGPALAALEHDVAAGVFAPAQAAARLTVARSSAPFVGRSRERADLHDLLTEPPPATVTVTGPGGVGKTRLVTELAADLSVYDAVAMVRLAPIRQPGRVTAAVAEAVGVRLGDGACPTLGRALAGRTLTIVLDNCEHVVDACRDLVSALHDHAPGVRVVATSRVPLGVAGEYVLRLQPLPVDDAVEAFVGHALRRHRSFAPTTADALEIKDIVTRLDGLPLAIELAAGQAGNLPLPQLGARLGRALDMFEAHRPRGEERQRTLRSTIEWSYQLLDPAEQALLLALAPFVGGVGLDTVEHIGEELGGRDPVAVLLRLVDASLVVAQPDDPARYSLLETVRAYLVDRLRESGRLDEAEDRVVGWAVATAAEIGTDITGPGEPVADHWLRAELANLDAAVAVASRRGDVEPVVDILRSIDDAMVWRDLGTIGRWSLDLVDHPALAGHPSAPLVLGRAAEAAWLRGEIEHCEALARRGLAIDATSGLCRGALAIAAMIQARFDEGCEEGVRAAATLARPCVALAGAALCASYAGRADAAHLIGAARVAVDRDPQQSHACYVDYVEGEIAAAVGDHAMAAEMLTAAIARARTCGAAFVDGLAMVALTSTWAAAGRVSSAAEGYRQLMAYFARAGNWTQLWTTARNAAELVAGQGCPELALMLLEAADRSPTSAGMSEAAAGHLAGVRSAATAALGDEGAAAALAQAARRDTMELVEQARETLATLS